MQLPQRCHMQLCFLSVVFHAEALSLRPFHAVSFDMVLPQMSQLEPLFRRTSLASGMQASLECEFLDTG